MAGATVAAAAAVLTLAITGHWITKKRHRRRPLVRLEYINNITSATDICSILKRDGAVIIENVVERDKMRQLQSDILALQDTEYSGTAESSFAGAHTRRCGPYVLETSVVARQLAAHELHTRVSELLLAPVCQRIRLSVVAGIRVMPGGQPQTLHRDDDEWPLSLMGRVKHGIEVECSAMWAITDFTATNGATQVVVGSQGWHGQYDAVPSREACQSAVMSAGSVLLFTGSVWHGTGANTEAVENAAVAATSTTGRMGLLVQHIAGWLHPEYNLQLRTLQRPSSNHH